MTRSRIGTQPEEQCVALTPEFRLRQRRRGHRFSVDDMLVAHVACTQARPPRSILDLGCGIGSVLLICGWRWPEARLVGLEAQAESALLARRNLALNRCEARGRIVEGDLRDGGLVASLGAFDLVTASPPYLDPRASTPSPDPQRAQARWETRGGIEEYARAASHAIGPAGLFVTCAAADPAGRAEAALAVAGMRVAYRRAVVPAAGRRPFLLLLAGTAGRAGAVAEAPPLVLRDRDGGLTAEHAALRDWLGLRRPAPGA